MTLHLTNAYHATSGGVSTFYRALIRYANDHRREMRLVVPAAESSVERIGSHAVIYHVAADNSPVADTRYRLLWPFGKTGRRIREILRAEQPALIEISDKYTLPMLAGFLRKGWIKGIRSRPALVATSHERMDHTARAYFATGSLGSTFLWSAISRVFLKQYYFPMFDNHLANSAYTAEELIPASQGHRLPRELRVLPMGVDADGFHPAARGLEARGRLINRAGVAHADARLLLYVGRLSSEKNLPMLVEMIQLLPQDFYLLIAGAGPLQSWLQSQATRIDRIRLLGHVQHAQVAALFAGADAFVHPNAREPFGIAPLEAMAAGLPLIAPNQGGILSYAASNNAWLATPTASEFARAALESAADPDERARRAENARQIAIDHHWPTVAARYFAVFDEWIAEKERWG